MSDLVCLQLECTVGSSPLRLWVSRLVLSHFRTNVVVYGIGFRNMDYKAAFLMMGSIVIVSSFLSILIHIPCHAGLLWGEDNHTVLQSRERYRLQRERAQQAIEEQNHARHNRNPAEGGATVESMDKGEQNSDDGDDGRPSGDAATEEEPRNEATNP